MSHSQVEYEAKVLNINEDEIAMKLEAVGAVKGEDYTFRRYVFDTIPATPNRWVRLRSNGVKTTLTVKEIHDDSIEGTYEWEVMVSDIDECLMILEKIGISPRGYQENRRVEYDLGGVEISIDYWPGLEPYMEIEGKDKASVIATAKQLGFTETDLTSRNTEALYLDEGINLKEIKELKFEEK